MRVHRESAAGPTKNQPLRLPLNKKLVEGLEPTESRYYIHDSRQQGLTIAIHPSGEKSWIFLKKLNGRSRRLALGKFPQVTVESARNQVKQHHADIAKGGDPFAKRAGRRTADTLGKRWETFLEDHVTPHCQPSTEAGYRWTWEKHLAHWKNRKLWDLTAAEIRAWHIRVGKTSPYQANRNLALLSSIFRHNNKDGPNPCRDVKRFKESSRDRFIGPDEMRRFFEALDNEPNQTFADFLRLSLFTGARQSNVCEMRWEDINLESRVWRITRTKNNEPLSIPLSGPAVDVLVRRKETAESEWVLPGRSESGHITRPKTSWERLLKSAGISGLRMHDLRRTFGSFQAAAGASLPVIGKSLGHKTPTATAVYSRLDMDPVRASVEIATRAMLEAAKGGES